MELLLALIAIVVTVGACVLAWRARRASHHLALEMVELRDRLAEAERAHLEAADTVAAHRGHEDDDGDVMASRMVALEAQVRSTMQSASERHDAAAGDEALDGPRMRVIKHLRRKGYDHVSVLEIRADGSMLVEADRGGVAAKGVAVLDADGRVRVRFQTSLRAFP